MREVLEAVDAPWSIRIGARVLGWPFKWLGLAGDADLPPVVRALTALGPAYIKFGQILSTRPDVVGAEMARDLRILQDDLPAFSDEEAKEEIARELGQEADEIFAEFSTSVAAASIAQVHKATLRSTGEEVAVKVLRPGIEREFLRDVDAFYLIAFFVEKLAPGAKRLKPHAVIEHFEGVVQGELDLRMEAAAAAEFKANSAEDPNFRVPGIRWDLSARRVMTMDWEDGVAMGDPEALRAQGADLRELATDIIQTFLRHALRDGYFHADMHQGNLKLGPDGAIVALDFGIMGRIDAYTRRVYAEILIGFLQKDYKRVAEVHFEAGYVPRDQDVDAFAQALRSVGEPIFGMDSTHISMARLLAHLFDVTDRFGMETRTELILLQRTMVVVEGVARSLDPAMNMWETARPVVETYIRDALGPRALARDMVKTAKVLSRFGPRLPELAERALMAVSEPSVVEPRRDRRWLWAVGGAVLGGLAVALFG